uniref:TERF1 (TRF1)-interacting nuclear factor 2 n=1 Tax=Echeneis naucrates TaxID=173247 RepID=A0A665V3I2_ECHNA
MWKVLKQRDVMQYGVVEEFVTSACECVPGLLTLRHQGKLALGLRGRLCSTQPDVKRKDVKVMRTVENFHLFVETLLTNPAEREQFFKEEFPVDYGPKFDEELEKLLWEFLIRMDQLLPPPSLAQTVSWLSDTPAVLEECARSATQPQLLNTLLQHQACLGHLEVAASLPPNMGESILDSLSLPPSGRLCSFPATGSDTSAVDRSREKSQSVAPVIGLICNEDVPVMISARKKMLRGDEAGTSKDATSTSSDPKKNLKFTVVKQTQDSSNDGMEEERNTPKRSKGMKRKQLDIRQSESDEEEDYDVTMSRKKRLNRVSEGKIEDKTVRNKESNKADLATCLNQLGVKTLNLPHDPSLCSIFVSCLTYQPRVIVKKLSVDSDSANAAGQGGLSVYKELQPQTRKSPVKTPTRRGKSVQQVSDISDVLCFSYRLPQLFMKRYYRTKHGTYVPTLREFWKPRVVRRDLLSAGSKRR